MIMGTITGVLLVSILYIAQVTGVTMVHDTAQYLLIEGARRANSSTRNPRSIR